MAVGTLLTTPIPPARPDPDLVLLPVLFAAAFRALGAEVVLLTRISIIKKQNRGGALPLTPARLMLWKSAIDQRVHPFKGGHDSAVSEFRPPASLALSMSSFTASRSSTSAYALPNSPSSSGSGGTRHQVTPLWSIGGRGNPKFPKMA